MKAELNFDKLTYLGVKMVLGGCCPISLAVAVLAQTNHLDIKQCVELKNRMIDQLR